MATSPHEQHEETEETITLEPAKVILFNDEVHTFEEVITQLIKALKCALPIAESITMEVHHSGKAVAYTGEMIRCIEISNILEEIQLMTQIEV